MADGLRMQEVRIAKDGAPLVALDRLIPPGEVLTVMGPSGVGKSTLLAFVTGTLPPAFTVTGRVILNGHDITETPPHQRRVGILFQDDLLFPHLSVGANLAFGLRPGGTRAERRARVEEALEQVQLAGFADRDPATLSGGQRARISLMRVLLSEPSALLLDEAFSRLDTALRSQVRELVFDRVHELRLPALMVTHDAEDAAAAGGPVVTFGT